MVAVTCTDIHLIALFKAPNVWANPLMTDEIALKLNAETIAAKDLRYAWYVAVVLMLCNTLSFIDRQILGLLVTPIKLELGISDTRIGLLQGLAFGIFYTLLGSDRFEIEFLVERGGRQQARHLRKVLRQERRKPLECARFRRRIALLNVGLVHGRDLGRRHRTGGACTRGVLADMRQAVVGNFLAAQNERCRHVA